MWNTEQLHEDDTIVDVPISPMRHVRSLVSPGLTVVHMTDGVKFTVTKVTPEHIEMAVPDRPEVIRVSLDTFTSDYAVD